MEDSVNENLNNRKKMQQMNKSKSKLKSKKSKSVRNSASERRIAYEIEIQIGDPALLFSFLGTLSLVPELFI
jgi:predicted secreted acid phosphatase